MNNRQTEFNDIEQTLLIQKTWLDRKAMFEKLMSDKETPSAKEFAELVASWPQFKKYTEELARECPRFQLYPDGRTEPEIPIEKEINKVALIFINKMVMFLKKIDANYKAILTSEDFLRMVKENIVNDLNAKIKNGDSFLVSRLNQVESMLKDHVQYMNNASKDAISSKAIKELKQQKESMQSIQTKNNKPESVATQQTNEVAAATHAFVIPVAPVLNRKTALPVVQPKSQAPIKVEFFEQVRNATVVPFKLEVTRLKEKNTTGKTITQEKITALETVILKIENKIAKYEGSYLAASNEIKNPEDKNKAMGVSKLHCQKDVATLLQEKLIDNPKFARSPLQKVFRVILNALLAITIVGPLVKKGMDYCVKQKSNPSLFFKPMHNSEKKARDSLKAVRKLNSQG